MVKRIVKKYLLPNLSVVPKINTHSYPKSYWDIYTFLNYTFNAEQIWDCSSLLLSKILKRLQNCTNVTFLSIFFCFRNIFFSSKCITSVSMEYVYYYFKWRNAYIFYNFSILTSNKATMNSYNPNKQKLFGVLNNCYECKNS